jgi:hypothetical protein
MHSSWTEPENLLKTIQALTKIIGPKPILIWTSLDMAVDLWAQTPVQIIERWPLTFASTHECHHRPAPRGIAKTQSAAKSFFEQTKQQTQ